MVAINFNATQFDPSTGSQDVFETGEYGFMINASEVKPTKAGGTMLVLTAKCIDEGQMGKQATIRLNIQNASAQAVEIAFRDLSAICHVVGVLNMTDTQQLHGRPFRMRMEKTPRSDKPDLFGNEIRGYLDAQGNPPTPGQASGGGSTPAAPAAPAAPVVPVAVAPPVVAPPAAVAPPAEVAPIVVPAPAAVAPSAAVAPVAAGAVPPWQQ